MVKHLYFNPCNFEELILNGILIELFKSDVEVHPINTDQDSIRFVHGQYQIQDNRQAILRYANSICKKHIFGHNSRQEAVIKMINGVCNDIGHQIKTDSYSYEFIQQRVHYLNDFWFSTSSQWLKRQFYQCHMTILNLSFVLQQRHPQFLTKFRIFVAVRKFFLEEGIVSKESLIAMFANEHNRYKEFDLYPEEENVQVEKAEIHEQMKTETTEHEVKDQEGQMVKQDVSQSEQLQGKISQIIETIQQTSLAEHVYSSQTHNMTQNVSQPVEVPHENQVIHSYAVHQSDQPKQQESVTFSVSEQLTRYAQQSVQHQVKTLVPAQISTKAQTHEEKHEEKPKVITDEHQVITSDEYKYVDHKHTQEHENILIPKQIIETLVQNVEHLEEEGNLHTEKNDQNKIDIKRSLKESFSQFVAKPLEYSTRSLAQNEEQKLQKKKIEQIDDIQAQKNNEKQNAYEKHQDKPQQKPQTIQLSKDAAFVQQAQSEKYVSQEHFTEAQQTKTQQPKTQPQKSALVNHQELKQAQHLSENRAPQSQTNQSSESRPQSQMARNKIKSKEQSAPRNTQSCKCSIY